MADRRRPGEFQAAVFGGLLVCALPAMAADVAVIVARDALTQTLNAGELRDVYLKKIVLDAAGRKFIPVNLPADAALRQAFTLTLFHKTGDELQDYWNQNYFHGITPPYVLGSQDAVVRFVARTPGAIGYVAPCYLNPGVRAILMLPIDPAAEADAGAACPPGTNGSPDTPQ